MNAVTSSPQTSWKTTPASEATPKPIRMSCLSTTNLSPLKPVRMKKNWTSSISKNSNSDDDSGSDHRLPNGYVHCMENGVSSLDLSSDDEGEREQKEVEEDEELRMREESDVAIQRAFREDENRRNARLDA
nr:uncharacterized protein LOC113731067 [Coffea arabica]